jgi:hypothetical protein
MMAPQQLLCNAAGVLKQLLIQPLRIISLTANYPSLRHRPSCPLSHPPPPHTRNSPEAILSVFRERIPAFDKTEDGFTKWVMPTVNVLHALSDMLGQVFGLVNIRIYPHDELLL